METTLPFGVYVLHDSNQHHGPAGYGKDWRFEGVLYHPFHVGFGTGGKCGAVLQPVDHEGGVSQHL